MKATSSSGRGGGGSKKTSIGCIGKCTTDLSITELDRITNHVQYVLECPKGRKLFIRYLAGAKMSTNLQCVELYEKLGDIVSIEQGPKYVYNLIFFPEPANLHDAKNVHTLICTVYMYTLLI